MNTIGEILVDDGNGAFAPALDVPIAGSVYIHASGAIADFNGDESPMFDAAAFYAAADSANASANNSYDRKRKA